MRIAFVTFEYPPKVFGGAGVYAHSLTSELARMGHEVTVHVPDVTGPGSSEERGGVRVRWHTQRKAGIIGRTGFCMRVAKQLEREPPGSRPDVVHLNTMGYFALRDRRSGPAYISTGHHLSGDTARLGRLALPDRIHDLQGENGFVVPLLERYGVRFTDRYLAVSLETKEGLTRLYGVDPSDIDVVWNGVDGSAAPKGPESRSGLRGRLGLPDGPVLLFVGRVDDPRKGLLGLVRAVAALPGPERPTIAAVGSGSPERAIALAKELGSADRLAILGKLSPEDLWSAYLAADVHVCASRQEGFGLTIVEALCAGCPVISTRVGVAPELEGRIERLVPANDPEAMNGAISGFLRGREARPDRAEVLVPYEFSWQRCAASTVEAYERTLAARAKGRKVRA